jgi:hypothetical protein
MREEKRGRAALDLLAFSKVVLQQRHYQQPDPYNNGRGKEPDRQPAPLRQPSPGRNE